MGSLSTTHSTKVKNEYPTTFLVSMEKIKYMKHNWIKRQDLKKVNFLLVQ